MKKVLVLYNDGLRLYKERKFQDAVKLFKDVLQIEPEDGPSEMYVKRCKEFIEHPPPPDWDGVYVMKTK